MLPLHDSLPQLWREIFHRVPSKEKLKAAPKSSIGNKTAKGCKLAVLEIFSDATVAMVQDPLLPPLKL